MKMGPVQEDVLKYWLGACPPRRNEIPSRADMKVTDLRSRMASIAIVDIEQDPVDFRYRLIGTHFREFMFNDYTGKLYSEIRGKGRESEVWKLLEEVRTSGKPIYTEIPYIGPKSDFMRASNLCLPLADNHHNVDKIMLVADFQPISSAGWRPKPPSETGAMTPISKIVIDPRTQSIVH